MNYDNMDNFERKRKMNKVNYKLFEEYHVKSLEKHEKGECELLSYKEYKKRMEV